VKIGKYEFPDDLLYDKEHNWARVEGDRVTQGMTDLGQALAGEIVFAEVPRVGRTVEQGQPFMTAFHVPGVRQVGRKNQGRGGRGDRGGQRGH